MSWPRDSHDAQRVGIRLCCVLAVRCHLPPLCFGSLRYNTEMQMGGSPQLQISDEFPSGVVLLGLFGVDGYLGVRCLRQRIV